MDATSYQHYVDMRDDAQHVLSHSDSALDKSMMTISAVVMALCVAIVLFTPPTLVGVIAGLTGICAVVTIIGTFVSHMCSLDGACTLRDQIDDRLRKDIPYDADEMIALADSHNAKVYKVKAFNKTCFIATMAAFAICVIGLIATTLLHFM